MKIKFLLVFVVIILVTGIIYFFENNKKVSIEDSKKIEELVKNELNVIYTNEGFTPKEIKIKKGEKIKFINLSDRKMWVASNNHPEHDIYPEFDQKEITLRGTEYEFTFEKIGNWGYHNHLYSNHTGTIIVE